MVPDGLKMCTTAGNLPMQTLDPIEKLVRDECGLMPYCKLNPGFPNRVTKQDDAIIFRQDLLAKGDYDDRQVGLFARDISKTGAKSFFVHTFAGLAIESPLRSAQAIPQHIYELFLDGKPCWLYFDLEFNRIANPSCNPEEVAKEFYMALDRFFLHTLGSPHDAESVVELDSTVSEKFSKHVLVKRLQNGQPLAFGCNAHAGVLVEDFIAYLKAEVENDTYPSAKKLFFNNGESAGDESKRTESLIDACVYSRNRCFRILFSSKFEKNRPLVLSRGKMFSSPPPLQLLDSFASFVPAGTALFSHPNVPLPIERERTRPKPRHGKDTRPEEGAAHSEGTRGNFVRVTVQQDSPYCNLFEFLVGYWDQTRSEKESGGPTNKTRVQSSVLLGSGRYLCVTLQHNRFCFCKGASHKANSIYFVVDLFRRVYYQKCHDVVDCGRDFRSEENGMPGHLLHLCLEEDPCEIPQAVLSQAVEETQVLASHDAYLGDMVITQTLMVSTDSLHQGGLDLSATLDFCSKDYTPTLVVSTGSSKKSGLDFSQTLHLCSNPLETTLVTCTPVPRQMLMSQSATPAKVARPTPTGASESRKHLRDEAAWHSTLGNAFAPTMRDEPAELDTLVQRTQLEAASSDSEARSARGTEIDSDCLESGPSQGQVTRTRSEKSETQATPAHLSSHGARKSVCDQLFSDSDEEGTKSANMNRHLGDLADQLCSGGDGDDDDVPCEANPSHNQASVRVSHLPLRQSFSSIDSKGKEMRRTLLDDDPIEVDAPDDKGKHSNFAACRSTQDSLESVASIPMDAPIERIVPVIAKRANVTRRRDWEEQGNGRLFGGKALNKRARV